MTRYARVACALALGLLVTACDKCGNWNINTPKFCNEIKPQG